MRNKRKGIMMAAAILGSAAIISTGFAAWVVTTESNATATGNISVDYVEDRTHNIEVITEGQDLTVAYGFAADANVTKPWLTAEGTVINEDFTVVYNFKVSNPKTCDFETPVFTYTDTTKEDFKNAIEKEYIAQPTVVVTKASDFATSGNASLTFTFGWGDYFKVGETNVNPYTFFNGKDAKATAPSGKSWAKEAIDVLTEIYKANGVSFSVTISTKTVSAQAQQ